MHKQVIVRRLAIQVRILFVFHTEKKFLKRIIMRIARKGFEYYRAETDRFRDIKISAKLRRNTAVPVMRYTSMS